MPRAEKTGVQFAAVAFLAVTLVLSIASVAAAYTQNVYVSSYFHNQSDNCWCVPASTKNWIKYIDSSFSTSQADIDTYEATKDKYSGGGCGHDPRGWAWGMYHYTPAGYGFNDYMDTSQSLMNWELVDGVRGDGNPDGALVAKGKHAVDVVGYHTLYDPFTTLPHTLYGFYILDPWYGRGSSGLPNWPYDGFSPNSYITIDDWNSLYFLKDTNDGSYWDGDYVAVLRASTSAQPSNTPPESYGDYVNPINAPIGESTYVSDV